MDYNWGDTDTLVSDTLDDDSDFNEEEEEQEDDEIENYTDQDDVNAYDIVEDGIIDQAVHLAARRNALCTNYETHTRHLGDKSCVLSEYLKDCSDKYYSLGYLGSSTYVVPLHVLSLVPGHKVHRLAIHKSNTTTDVVEVYVECLLNKRTRVTRRGSRQNSKDQNQFCPPNFEVICSSKKEASKSNCPLVLGNNVSNNALSGVCISYESDEMIWNVPNLCNNKNYRRPCGLGSTLVSNNVVLMYPEVQQYLIPEHLRIPKEDHLRFLCCCSSPSSASPKGLIRHAVDGTVVRCYKKGVDLQLTELILDFYNMNCTCDEADVILSVAGCEIELCRSCLCRLEEICLSYSRVSPHCITLHYYAEELVTLSFCTGSLMRFSNPDNKWVDSASIQSKPSDYTQILSSISLMIPFLSYISPTRAGMLSTFLSQSICTPSCRYDPCRVVVPLYNESPLMCARVVEEGSVDMLSTSIPGLNVFVVFCNLDLTHEDGMVMSASAAYRYKYLCVSKIKMT
jgi:hypothetical protein